VLQITLVDSSSGTGGQIVGGLAPETPLHGLATVFLGPTQFGLAKSDQALFYVRAFAKTASFALIGGKPHFQCPDRMTAGSSCGDRFAYTNPIWGRYHVTCPAVPRKPRPGFLGLARSPFVDSDGNRVPDTCERDLPDPCPQRPPRGGRFGEVGAIPEGVRPPVAVDPDRPPAGPQPAKAIPANSCQMVKSLAVKGLPPGVVGPEPDPVSPR
jgi:hypothetical protein